MFYAKKKEMLGNAAGCYSCTIEELQALEDTLECDTITTKTMTLLPKKSNDLPIEISREFSLNSVGLSNLGFDAYYKFASDPRRKKPIVLSLSTHNLFETVDMLQRIENAEQKIEFNISCPNISHSHTAEETLRKLFEMHDISNPFGVKMPPAFSPTQLEHLLDAACYCPTSHFEFITCCNTIPIRDEGGGLGGKPCKPVALKNVKMWTHFLDKVSIIGCGGIYSAQDVFEYLHAGAQSVQLGSVLLSEGPDAFKKCHPLFLK